MLEIILGFVCLVETGFIFYLFKYKNTTKKKIVGSRELLQGLLGESTYSFSANNTNTIGPKAPRMNFVVNGYELSDIIRYCEDLEKI